MKKELKRARSMRFCTGGAGDNYLQVPFLFSMISGLNQSVKINTSQLFSYGGFSKVNPANRSLFKKFGFNDRFSVNESGSSDQNKQSAALLHSSIFPISTSTYINTGETTQRGWRKQTGMFKRF
ncbi:hypothetical protein RZN08_18435 [Bacillus paralicheniformis]|nr:hypothetical protein RZN08_18435 [Bacillus paralicheniformis]